MSEAIQTTTPVSAESQTARQDVPSASTQAGDFDAETVRRLAINHFERLRQRATDRQDVYDMPDDTGYEDMAPARRITNGMLFTYDDAYVHNTHLTFERALPALQPRMAETSASYKAAQSMALQYVTAPGTSWRNAGPMDSQAWMAFMAGTRPDMADLTKSWLAWPLAKAYIGRLTLDDVRPFLFNWVNYYDRSDFAHWGDFQISERSPAFDVGFLTPSQYASVLAGNVALPAAWQNALAIPFPNRFSSDADVSAWVNVCASAVSPRLVITDPIHHSPDMFINQLYHAGRALFFPGAKIILVDLDQYLHGAANLLANNFVARNIPAGGATSFSYNQVAHYLEEHATYDEKLAGMLLASFVFNRYRGSALLSELRVVTPDLTYLFARFSPVNIIVDSFDASHAPPLLPFTMFRVANFAVELAMLRAYAYDEVRRGHYVTRQDYQCAVTTAHTFNAIMGQFGLAFGDLSVQAPFDHSAAVINSPLSWFEASSIPLGAPDFHSLTPSRSTLLGGGWHYRRGKRVENPLDRATQRAFAWAAAAAFNDGEHNRVIYRWTGAVYANMPVRGFIPVNAVGSYAADGMSRPRPVIVPLSAGIVDAEEETINNGLDVILTFTTADYQATLVSSVDGRPGTVYDRLVIVSADPFDAKTQLLPTDGNYDFLGL